MRILIVEDNKDIAEVYKAWLEDEGHEVVSLTNGIEALTLITKIYSENTGNAFDAYIIDYHLPSASGEKIYDILKTLEWKKDKHPLVLISGDSTALDQLTGNIHKLEKPISKDCLLYTSPSPRDV